MNRPLINVLILSVSFLIIFSANNTASYIQKVVVDGINAERPDLQWDAYLSLSLAFIVYSFSNFFVPSIYTVLSYERCLFLSSLLYFAYILIFLYPFKYGLLLFSMFQGFAQGVIWTTEYNCLVLNSSSKTLDRNTGIFWSLYQMGSVIGNLFCYFQFQDVQIISHKDRQQTYTVLSIIAFIGCLPFLFLKRVESADKSKINCLVEADPLTAFKNSFTLLKTKQMILISVCSFYSGLEMSFYLSIYATAVSYTKSFGPDSSKFIGLYGVTNGLGGFVGALLFNTILKRFLKNSRGFFYFLGLIAHLICFFLIFINHPNACTSEPTEEFGFIKPRISIVLICGFLLNIGDSIINTQVISLTGTAYRDNVIQNSAFALNNFFLAIGTSISFFYASFNLTLIVHLSILVLFSILSTFSFYFAEKITNHELMLKSLTIKS